MCRTIVVFTASVAAPHRWACSNVSSWLASSEMITSASRSSTGAGIRSRVAANVDAALYATTTMPIFGPLVWCSDMVA